MPSPSRSWWSSSTTSGRSRASRSGRVRGAGRGADRDEPGSVRSSIASPARTAGWGSMIATRVTGRTLPSAAQPDLNGGRESLTSGGVPSPPPSSSPGSPSATTTAFLALDAVDLAIADGAFFGLLGPNGAGKTTLISAVCNLIRVTDGEARIFGHPHAAHEARRLIGLAEQDVNLDRFLDVEETLLYHGGYYGMDRAHARARAGEMMDVFDLRAKASTRAPRLSGGMRRRLLLARALMHEPRLVILDEPTAGVDFELRLELWRYIRRLHGEGTTILLTTHYLEEAEELCEDIALIRGGRVIARDTADGLRASLRRRLARRRLRQGDGQLTTAVHARGRPAAVGMVLAAAASLQVGAAFAVTLFDDLGPGGRGVPAARARRDRAVDRLAPVARPATCGWRRRSASRSG